MSIRKGLSNILARVLPESGKFVGTDKFGNKFYSKWEKNFIGEEVERRYLKPPYNGFFTSMAPEDFEIEKVSVEWSSWMMHRRAEPPTPEESARLEFQREQIQEKVRALAAEEARAKLRARALGSSEASKPDMNLLQSQMSIEDGSVGPAAMGGGKFQPKAWTPGGAASPARSAPEPSNAEPVGTGDSFKPGTWSPGQPK